MLSGYPTSQLLLYLITLATPRGRDLYYAHLKGVKTEAEKGN